MEQKTSEVRRLYVQLQEELLSETSKLYQYLVHEETPEKVNWGHVGDIQRALESIRHINSIYVMKTMALATMMKAPYKNSE